ncbi:unnamed protein product, partial [Strongylus vulgaris]
IRFDAYGLPTVSYKGPLESTARHSELEPLPLRDYAQAYHSGQSWDIVKDKKIPVIPSAPKEHGEKKDEVSRGGKEKVVPHMKTTPAKEQSPTRSEEETKKIKLIARVPHKTSEDEFDSDRSSKDRSPSLLGFWKAGKRKQQEAPVEEPHLTAEKYAGPVDSINLEKDIDKLPFKAPPPVPYKPKSQKGEQQEVYKPSTHAAETTHKPAHIFGRWRHEGDEETVEKDKVRIDTYGLPSGSYEGPLESTARHSDLQPTPLRDHARVYHHGQSWNAVKDTKSPILHVKQTPSKNKALESEEEEHKIRLIARVLPRVEEDSNVETKRKEPGLKFSKEEGTVQQKAPIVKSTTVRETTPQRSNLSGRWRHEGEEETIAKDRVRPETYGGSSTSYEGPLESTTRSSELEPTPLRDYSQAYHSGQSWNGSEDMRTAIVGSAAREIGEEKSESKTSEKKAILHLKKPAVGEKSPSSGSEEETRRIKLIARVPPKSEDETKPDIVKKDKDSSGLFGFWKAKSKQAATSSDKYHPAAVQYTGPLDDIKREKDIDKVPFIAPTPVAYKSSTLESETTRRAHLFGRWRHEGEEETIDKSKVKSESYGLPSTSYEGPLEPTAPQAELELTPLKDYARAYHFGQSWNDAKYPKGPITGREGVTEKKPAKEESSSPASEDDERKIKLIAHVQRHSTEENDAGERKPKKEQDSTGLFGFWKAKSRQDKTITDEYHPSAEKYKGPLDSINREKDIDQRPFKAPSPPAYKPKSPKGEEKGQHAYKSTAHAPTASETTKPHIFGHWRHEGEEETIEKDKVRSDTYRLPSGPYKGPLESIARQ